MVLTREEEELIWERELEQLAQSIRDAVNGKPATEKLI